jgi:hypothetical protein
MQALEKPLSLSDDKASLFQRRKYDHLLVQGHLMLFRPTPTNFNLHCCANSLADVSSESHL